MPNTDKEQLYEDKMQVRRWREKIPDDDLQVMVDLIQAYKLGRKIFMILFFSCAAAGAIALIVFGFISRQH